MKKKATAKKTKKTKRRLWPLLSGIALVVVLAGGYYVNQLVMIAAAYQAKTLCSGVFVSGRDQRSVESEELAANPHPILSLLKPRVNRDAQSVTSGFFGLPQREAIYRPGLGCTLIIGVSAEKLRAELAQLPLSPRLHSERRWPQGEKVDLQRPPRGIDTDALRATMGAAFDEPDPKRQRHTRAVIVVYDGRIIAERYAPGFSADMPMPGWSMSKTMTAALIGILKDQGKIKLDQPAPIPEWQRDDDPRRKITVAQLLHMSSGLAFSEDYTDPKSDVVRMLFANGDMSSYAISRPLVSTPGSIWKYSTGTTNILSRIVNDMSGDTLGQRVAFPRRALFDRIGMNSALIETDATNTFVGSSLMFATARDWARLGLLYLHNGVWNRQHVLPTDWVQYSRTATPPPPGNAPDFGAHLWLRVPEPFYSRFGERPTLPPDTFHFVGYQGQFVSVIPSRKLVVVRLGLSAPWSWDQEEFLVRLLRATPPTK